MLAYKERLPCACVGWSCTTWENVSAAVDTVRADLPRGEAILYYNEAYPVFAYGKCSVSQLSIVLHEVCMQAAPPGYQ